MESLTFYAKMRLLFSWYNNDTLELNKGDKITFFNESELVEHNNVKRRLGPGCFSFYNQNACGGCIYYDTNPFLPCAINPTSARAGMTCDKYEARQEPLATRRVVITNCLIRMDGLSCRTHPSFASMFSIEPDVTS